MICPRQGYTRQHPCATGYLAFKTLIPRPAQLFSANSNCFLPAQWPLPTVRAMPESDGHYQWCVNGKDVTGRRLHLIICSQFCYPLLGSYCVCADDGLRDFRGWLGSHANSWFSTGPLANVPRIFCRDRCCHHHPGEYSRWNTDQYNALYYGCHLGCRSCSRRQDGSLGDWKEIVYAWIVTFPVCIGGGAVIHKLLMLSGLR